MLQHGQSCAVRHTFAMSAPSLAGRLVPVVTNSALAGHLVGVGLVAAHAIELAPLWAEDAELRRPMGWPSGNSGRLLLTLTEHRTRAAFPAGAKGCHLQALAVNLRHAKYLSVAWLWELHRVVLPAGTVETFCRRVVRRLAACLYHLRATGQTSWPYAICNEALTSHRLEGRGDSWTQHVGAAVHDHLATYGC